MTQAKLEQRGNKQTAKTDKEKSLQNPVDIPKCINDSCIQVCAWVLLTLGLCIIVSTFYLAIRQRNNDNDEGLDVFEKLNKNDNLNKKERSFDISFIDGFNRKINGCQEKYCKVMCTQAVNVYTSLYDTLLLSLCTAVDVLLISNQDFPDGLLRNSWIFVADTSVHEFMLMSSNVSVIKNGAFNSPIFSTTYRLVWQKLNLQTVEGGALLGLNQLKHLEIKTQMNALDRAFFQPVQTTLAYLVLHVGITVAKGQNIFGISYLNKLVHLDLSHNQFNGPLKNNMFRSTPNLKYLVMRNAEITAMADDTFENLVDKLQLLDLAQNHLTTISSDSIQPLLTSTTKTFISLSANSLICDCDIAPFSNTYTTFRDQFVEDLHCKAPHHLYGTSLDQVNLLELNCDLDDTSVSAIPDSYEINATTSGPILNDGDTSNEIVENAFFKMRCMEMIDTADAMQSRSLKGNSYKVKSSSIASAINWNDLLPLSDADPQNVQDELDYFQFEPPEYDFEVHLLDNRSVKVSIEDFEDSSPVNIIWFSEQMEDFDLTHAGATIDYDCMGYTSPYLILDGMTENTTYTFCLIPNEEYSVTPFNCLPLHVPRLIATDDNIWITKDSKQFTVGILCLIFLLSTFFGAVVAYFGIKSYPDLLEGSKNVLVVKKSDRTCYISTISETEYLKNSSIKKQPLGGSMKQHSLHSAVSDTPSPISAGNLKRLSSKNSSSTCFEDAFVSISYTEDEYEMPKAFEKSTQIYEERCVPNNYGMSPVLPPPLPKRNSETTDNLTFVANRFSKPI